MDDFGRALADALDAARAFPTVERHVERAVALARFQARESRGPYGAAPLSPAFPAFALVREPRLDPLFDALNALQHELVWAVERSANRNAEQFLRAAGHLGLAAQAALGLAGAGLGLVLAPTTRIWDLTAGLGLQVSDLIADGEGLMGSLAGPRVRATYRWDLHHEEPVRSAEELGWRELTSYTVRFTDGRARCETALRAAHDQSDVAGRRRYGPFFVDAADTSAFTLEWYADAPDWALGSPDSGARLTALVDGLRTARTPGDLAALPRAIPNGGFEFRPSLPARALAEALGARDAFARTVDVHMSSWRLATRAGDPTLGDWRVEAALDAPPSGEPVPGLSLPAARAAVLTDGDAVRYVYARPARTSASRSA